MNRWLLIMVALIALSVVPSCAWIRGACAESMPTITVIHSYVENAQITLDSAQTQVDAMKVLDDNTRAELNGAIQKARVALEAVTRATGVIQTACTKPDPIALFADFVAAWNNIAALMAKRAATPDSIAPKLMIPAIVTDSRKPGQF